jgi:hypothetical protein
VTTFVRKSDEDAALVRARIADGSLRAGMYAPSGAEPAKETGFAMVTCRRGLQRLFREGVLMQMARSRATRWLPRGPSATPGAARARRKGQVVPRAIAVADVRGLLLLDFVCGQERRRIGGHPNAVDPHGRIPGPLQRVGDDHLEHLQSPVARQTQVHEGDRGLGHQSAL